MTSLYPLPLDEGLEAVECPGVGVEDDLGEAGDDEAEISPSLFTQEDSGLLSLEQN